MWRSRNRYGPNRIHDSERDALFESLPSAVTSERPNRGHKVRTRAACARDPCDGTFEIRERGYAILRSSAR